MLLVGRDPGAEEMRTGRPFVGAAGQQLDAMLRAAGIDRRRVNIANVVGVQPPDNDFRRHRVEDVQRGVAELTELVYKLSPNVVVTLGNEAAWALVDTWPGAKDGSHGSIFGAKDIQRRRGYLWGPNERSMWGVKVLTTLHPSAVMRDASGISEMLATADLSKAWSERDTPVLTRPRMDIEIVRTQAHANAAYQAIKHAGRAACDIEITKSYPHGVLCVAFAPSVDRAYVFTQVTLPFAYDLLTGCRLNTIWQNGQFDIHFLATRAGIDVAGDLDDIIVAWHTRWPEIAGAAVDIDGGKKGSKATRKSLAFFASLHSTCSWWKDYSVDDEGMYRLCGQDACLTLNTHDTLQPELEEMGLVDVYRMTMERVRPVAAMQARGVLIDEGRRRGAVRELEMRRALAIHEIRELARPLLTEHRDRVAKPELIWKRTVCDCCHNGSKARKACPTCAGLPTKMTKVLLCERYVQHVRQLGGSLTSRAAALQRCGKMTVKDLMEILLRPCVQCNGAGAWETYDFNPASNEQLSTLLYDVLRLPRRKGVDEATLKGLLGALHEVQRELHERADRQETSAAG